MGYSLFTFLGNKGSIHIELAHHLKLFVWIGQSWEKGKEKERREVIFLVSLDERREKWVDLEWLNFHEVKGRGIFGLFYNFIIKLPIYHSILLTNHIFMCINVKTNIFLSILFENQTRERICFPYFPSYTQTHRGKHFLFSFSFPWWFLSYFSLDATKHNLNEHDSRHPPIIVVMTPSMPHLEIYKW